MRTKCITEERLPQLLSDSVQKAFWEKVEKRQEHECWPWKSFLNVDGYGVFNRCILGKVIQFRAPQLAWVYVHKCVIPDGKVIRHTCKSSRSCCNPNHLILGTPRDNFYDEIKQGTNVKGETHGMCKLKESTVLEIRRLYSSGMKQSEIARLTGVSWGRVWFIVHRKNWKHI